jgi:hypothetical protein
MIVSFEEYTPPARFDSIPWTLIKIEESDTGVLSDATVWATIETVAISSLPGGVDADPSDPTTRNFTTDNASDTPDLWYRITFIDGSGNVSLPSVPVQNLENAVAAYATTDEFFRIIKKTGPSPEQIVAAQGDLDTATLEINAELDWADGHATATAAQLELLKGVCLDRAADLWRHRESAPGILGVVDEGVPTTPGRYSFARYISRLSPLKDQWGVA